MAEQHSPPWIDGLTIDQVLRETAAKYPNQTALAFDQSGWQADWSEFSANVDLCARGLCGIGVRSGDHVAVWATNVPEWIILQFATARIGAVLVAINPACRANELAYALHQSDARVLCLVDQFKSSDYLDLLGQACPEVADWQSTRSTCAACPKLERVVLLRGTPRPGMLPWNELLAAASNISSAEIARLGDTLGADDPINIQYTSGTTGLPKAAMLSHRSLLMNAFFVGQRQRLTDRDRICLPVPFYHCFGCVLGSLCAAVYGATLIVPAEFFDARHTLHSIEKHQATVLYGVPTMFVDELQNSELEQFDTSSLRTGIMAGAPCPAELMRRVIHDLGASEMTIAYGLTEASPVLTQTRTDDAFELRVKTVGQPLPGVEIKIVDPQSGACLPDGQTGELCGRGHGTMIGYYNDDEATHEAVDTDGWLHSGDLGVREPDGYIRITGRIKDMVIRGGENIFPREIEDFLFTHPDIVQASVVGVPDARFGEEICAWIKPKSGARLNEEQIREWCGRHISRQKVPRYIKLVSAFPQTVTGKIQKFRIREMMIRELGLEHPQATGPPHSPP